MLSVIQLRHIYITNCNIVNKEELDEGIDKITFKAAEFTEKDITISKKYKYG